MPQETKFRAVLWVRKGANHFSDLTMTVGQPAAHPQNLGPISQKWRNKLAKFSKPR